VADPVRAAIPGPDLHRRRRSRRGRGPQPWHGQLVFHIFGALAEFERDLIRDRTQAGLTAARNRGRRGGRPKTHALDTPRKVQMAQALYEDKTNSVADICRTLRISKATLYRYR
jgi:DNA invertase Pin-like site-specific DNA recombinase